MEKTDYFKLFIMLSLKYKILKFLFNFNKIEKMFISYHEFDLLNIYLYI